MNPIFEICEVKNCRIRITDRTQEDEQYIPENINDPLSLEGYYYNNKFKYSQTYTINIIQYTSTKDKYIVDTIYTQHCSYLDEAYCNLNKDGYYTIYHIILPSIEWLQEEISKEDNILDEDITIYVTDGSKIYQYKNQELLEIDPEVIAFVNTEGTTISRAEGDTFSLCHLYKCYITICKQIFNSMNIRCLNKNFNLENSTFNRDFLWMTISIIKYHVEFDELMEAQRLLETVNYCNGLCKEGVPSNTSKGCGCYG